MEFFFTLQNKSECLNAEVQFAKHIEECRVNIVLAQAAIEETLEELETLADNLLGREEKICELEILIQCLQNSLIPLQQDLNILLKPVMNTAEKISDAGELSLSYLTKVQTVFQLLQSLKNEIVTCFEKDPKTVSTDSRYGISQQSSSLKEISVLLEELSQQEMEVSQRYLEINSFQDKLKGLHSTIKDTQRNMEKQVHDKELYHNTEMQSKQKIKKLQMELESVQEDLEQCLKTFEPADVLVSDIE